MDIKILYEDDYLVAIGKPSGITVNRSDTTGDQQTIQDWAERHLQISNLKSQISNKFQNLNIKNKEKLGFGAWDLEFTSRAGIVHRLDKETSGILLIAKTPEVFVDLQRQFKERKIEKKYIALVHGKVTPLEGEISVPVGRLPFNRKRFGVVAGGREASTQYKVLNIKYLEKETLSLLELKPKTGRTHQIRVHLKYFNHPVFSDFLYAGRKTARNDRKVLPRLFLHAAGISFIHPIENKIIKLESPLPKELESFISKLN
ncbi:MAG: RluA family pseudouridine synthase [Candidatus Levybacteria bacterium]|nr:RluA family pseudouridine synthase [Candidatus Levybacteria bacterium]